VLANTEDASLDSVTVEIAIKLDLRKSRREFELALSLTGSHSGNLAGIDPIKEFHVA
jgi:hypothetical protein